MEYREGRCPKCNETMQIPVGRDRIICMFCGQEFSVEEGREADDRAFMAELERFREHAGSFFQDMEKTVKGFQRNQYEGSFQQYLIAHQENLKTIRSAVLAASDRNHAVDEISEIFLQHGRAVMDAHKGKLGRESLQMTMNMYMVTYVLPALLSVDHGMLSDLAEEICRKWDASFKNSKIQAADYDSLKDGFRRKLCYITTAVCEGLEKPLDCYELRVLKSYRDGYLAASPEGEAMIARYYDMAPTIVKRVNRKKDSKKIYRHLYQTYIAPCIRLIEEGDNEGCLKKYEEMVEMLREAYMQE